MSVIPHPPHSPHLAPCDFLLLPKTKLKLKGRRFDTIEEIHSESRRMLDRKGLQEAFQNGGDGGTGVYMRERTVSRILVANRPYGEFYDFYSVSPEYCGYTLVSLIPVTCISKVFIFTIIIIIAASKHLGLVTRFGLNITIHRSL
jgi:hypothetical protein